MSREGTPPVGDVQLVVGRNRLPKSVGWRLYSLKYQVYFPPLDQIAYQCLLRIEPPGHVPAGDYLIKYEDKSGQLLAQEEGKPDPQIEISEQQQVVSSPIEHATYEERKWQETARREASNLRRASFVTENKRLVETIANREQNMAATLSTMMQMVAQQTQIMAKQAELQGQSQKELLEQTARLIKEATTNLRIPTPPPPPADYAGVLNNLITAATTVATTGLKEASRSRRRLNSILIGDDRGPRTKKAIDKPPASTLPPAVTEGATPSVQPEVSPPAPAASVVPPVPPAAVPPAPAVSAPPSVQAEASPPPPAPAPETQAQPAASETPAATPRPVTATAPQVTPAAQAQPAAPNPSEPTKREAMADASVARVVDRPRKWSRSQAWYEVKRRFFSMSEGTLLWLLANPSYLLHFVNSLAEMCVPPRGEAAPC